MPIPAAAAVEEVAVLAAGVEPVVVEEDSTGVEAGEFPGPAPL